MTELLNASNFQITKKAQRIFRALNHPLRRTILAAIMTNNNEIMVTDLYILLRLEQSVCSQHLAILRGAGLVTTRRDGKMIYYSVSENRLEELVNSAKQLVKKAE